MYNGSIDLTTVIEKNAYKKAENKRSYLNFSIVPLKEVDKYGNTHTIYVSQTKEQREAKEEKIYIGKCKEIIFEDRQQPQPQQAVPIQNQNDVLDF